MATNREYHAFAEKWIEKFLHGEYQKGIIEGFAKDCFQLGLKTDLKYFDKIAKALGYSSENPKSLRTMIQELNDPFLLATAIFTAWRTKSHWQDEGLLSPNSQEYFLFCLTRLREITQENGQEYSEDVQITLSPEFEYLKKEVEKLKAEVCMLLLERDDLRHIQCVNIETSYLLLFGALEYRAYDLHCQILRLKRKMEIIQAKINRQEKIDVKEVEEILDGEFAEYKKKLDEKIGKMNDAIERSKLDTLTKKQIQEIKKLYHRIVKFLHPDLNPHVTEAQIQLLQNTIQAYEDGDLFTLRIISTMVEDPLPFVENENSFGQLEKERDRLTEILENIQVEIATIKSTYPYTMKELIQDPEKITLHREELKETIAQLKEVCQIYRGKVNEMMR